MRKDEAKWRGVSPVRKPHRLRPRRAAISLDELGPEPSEAELAPAPEPPRPRRPPAPTPAPAPALPALPAAPQIASDLFAPAASTVPAPAASALLGTLDPPRDQAWIYGRLAALFAPYAPHLEAEMHPRIGYSLKARRRSTGDEVPFGAVQVLDDGVEFRLFPLFEHPELLAGMSPALAQHLCSPTCFGFTHVESATLAELSELTRRAFACLMADTLA